MKQFIEAVFAGEAKAAFKGKYAMSLLTSINFYDHTTLQYLQAVSEDLEMQYVQGYSCDRHNFPHPEERENLLNFVAEFLVYAREKRPTAKEFLPLPAERREYLPAKVEDVSKQSGKKILLLTDAEVGSNLARMTDVFVKSSPNPVEVVHLWDLNMSGGCLGCHSCFYDGTCVYKDGFAAAYHAKFLAAEAVVWAMNIKDRHVSAAWKMFMDRAYFNGHGPELSGRQIGFLISGPLRQLPALKDSLQGLLEFKGRNVVGFVTDEADDSAQTIALIQDFTRRLNWSWDHKALRPATFLSLAAKLMKRDLIYRNRLVMRREHRLLKANGFYDYPRFSLKTWLLDKLLGLLLRKLHKRRAFYQALPRRMLAVFEGQVEIGGKQDSNHNFQVKPQPSRPAKVALGKEI
jgi:hypothetical protein